MLPSDYKRNYKFKTDTSKEQKYVNISIAVTIVLALLWFIIG